MKGHGGVICRPSLVGTPSQTVKIKRGGKGVSSGSAPQGRKRTRPYYVILRLLGEHSRSVGWFNGQRLKEKSK